MKAEQYQHRLSEAVLAGREHFEQVKRQGLPPVIGWSNVDSIAKQVVHVMAKLVPGTKLGRIVVEAQGVRIEGSNGQWMVEYGKPSEINMFPVTLYRTQKKQK